MTSLQRNSFVLLLCLYCSITQAPPPQPALSHFSIPCVTIKAGTSLMNVKKVMEHNTRRNRDNWISQFASHKPFPTFPIGSFSDLTHEQFV